MNGLIGVFKIKKSILILGLILLFFVPCAYSQINRGDDSLIARQVTREEISKGNQVIIDKINLESDLCYKNIEDTAQSYFWELREDFRRVFWVDRLVTLIGQFVATLLAFITAYYLMRYFENKKKVLKSG